MVSLYFMFNVEDLLVHVALVGLTERQAIGQAGWIGEEVLTSTDFIIVLVIIIHVEQR